MNITRKRRTNQSNQLIDVKESKRRRQRKVKMMIPDRERELIRRYFPMDRRR